MRAVSALRSLLGAAAAVLVVAGVCAAPAFAQGKLDAELEGRARRGGWSRVIVTLQPGADVSGDVRQLGGRIGRRLSVIDGMVVELPNGLLKRLAQHPAVARIDHDRPTTGHLTTAASVVGARTLQRATS